MAKLNRRGFINAASLSLGSAALGTAALGATACAPGAAATGRAGRLPREVWIATVSQNNLTAASPDEMVDRLLERMEETAPLQPDIVCLPEVAPFMNLDSGNPKPQSVAETTNGKLARRFAEYAVKHNCYVWCPMYTLEDGKIFNALVLLDRAGKVVGEYRKMHATPGEMEDGVTPGPLAPPVFKTDFGVVGAQICFDIEWLDGRQGLHDQGAEVVFWSSAFGGGEKLNMLATLFRYAVVSSTLKGVSRICDISGQNLAWTGIWDRWCCARINLEKAFLHTWPAVEKFGDIRKKYGQAVRITTFQDEEWSILESLSAEVKVVDVLKEFSIPTFDEMVREATELQNKKRGA